MRDDENHDVEPIIEWRAPFENLELNVLHAEAFEHRVLEDDWWEKVNTYSLGWVCLRHAGKLVGFANVAWDGGVHAFLLDTMVAVSHRRRGWATIMVSEAVQQAQKAGCEWLHVDFDSHLSEFYLEKCGFKSAKAGLIRLR